MTNALMEMALVASVFIAAEAQLGSSTSTDCSGVTFRAAGHVLIGTAQGVIAVQDIDQCMSACVNSRRRFNFFCFSGVFYYHVDRQNCILNSESRATRPDLYVADAGEKVEYFEIGCSSHAIKKRQAPGNAAGRNRNVLQLQTPEYGNWTMCDRQLMQHMRFKECRTFNPNNCQRNENGCDPSKEDQYDKEGGSTAGPGGNTPPTPIPGPGPDTSTMTSLTGVDTTAVSAVDTASTLSPIVRQNKRRLPTTAASASSATKESKPGPAETATAKRTQQGNGGNNQKISTISLVPAERTKNRGTLLPTPAPPTGKERKQIEAFDGRKITLVKTNDENQDHKADGMHWDKNKWGYYRIHNESYPPQMAQRG